MSPDVSQPEFRLATSADADLLLDFMRDYYLFDGHRYQREPARTALLGLINNPVFGLAWLVLDSGTPVGYIVLCFGYSLEYLGRDAFIDEFYLTESHRGRAAGDARRWSSSVSKRDSITYVPFIGSRPPKYRRSGVLPQAQRSGSRSPLDVAAHSVTRKAASLLLDLFSH